MRVTQGWTMTECQNSRSESELGGRDSAWIDSEFKLKQVGKQNV